ncbi:hypothetical protein NDU88_003123 [Pleurodeles waltl]|uniref:Uncharacterized protein n=1 Tax=Pleurodeles waltl TaxID=8319 RepID=A0AAV7KUR1_PLEWA|nr:hypothetical protein NDU88_003123 [Pleurodeles waltl]
MDSSDWRCSRALEESVCRSHGYQGAGACPMTTDFRVPGRVKMDNGPQEEEEENDEDAKEAKETEDTKEGKETADAGAEQPEGRPGNSDVPSETTDPVQEESGEETHKHRHVPGGVWLNKVRSFFKGQHGETQKSWDRGEEGRDGEEGLRGEQLGGVERGVAGREREGQGRNREKDTTNK